MSNRFFPNFSGYKITSRFGMRTLQGVTKMHNGIDLVARTDSGGSAVDSIAAHTGGTVCAVGYNSSAGNYIKIQTAPDVVMVYYHLRDKPGYQVGDTVAQGQIIGYMGSTGNSTGAHLHFGIKVGDNWIDPEPYLDKDYTTQEEKKVNVEIKVLKKGAKGDTVRALQALLVGYGHQIDVDGSFGGKTDTAVRAYQKANDLSVDGSVGRKTWNKLLGV